MATLIVQGERIDVVEDVLDVFARMALTEREGMPIPGVRLPPGWIALTPRSSADRRETYFQAALIGAVHPDRERWRAVPDERLEERAVAS